jgi:hypothetical protein
MLSPRRASRRTDVCDGDVLRGVKHTYDIETERWRKEECRVILSEKPFAEGGMRMCLKMGISSGKPGGVDPEYIAGVAKYFKANILPKHVV